LWGELIGAVSEKPVEDNASRHDIATASSCADGERSTTLETKLKSSNSTNVSAATVERICWMNSSCFELGA